MTSMAVVHDDGSDALQPNASRAMRLLRPIAEPSDIISAQNAARELVAQALLEGRDYGKIPGVDKPSLLKPGAERVTLAFGCYARFEIVKEEVDHDREVHYVKRKKVWRNAHRGDREFTWSEEAGVSLGLYRYVVRCDIIERSSDSVVGSCVGSCSTMEAKYIDRPRDCENTVIKMAEKRAHVGATLVTFGLSEQFTQDVEDLPQFREAAHAEAEPAITRESKITWGKMKGTPIMDLDDAYLAWAVEPDRKFGADTEKWQAAMRAEIVQRADDVQ